MINRRKNWRTMVVALALSGGAVVVGTAVAQSVPGAASKTTFDPFNPTLSAQTSRSSAVVPLADEVGPGPSQDPPRLQRPPIRDPFRPPIRSPIRP